jgi:putative component of membrane protein insertase Oxa1/YidC/SpoIIIJ protein YidD
MKMLLAFCLAFSFHPGFAQLSAADDSLIAATTFYHPQDFSYYQGPGNSSEMMQTRRRGVLEAYNPVALLFKGSMWTYQHVISPQLSSPCPYQISCSNFAKACISEYGIVKGTALAADRLMRCNRISLMDIPAIDFDPHTHHILDDPDWYKRHR